MNPEPLALTSFCSRIGSPAMKGARAIEPTSWVIASGRSFLRMKLLLELEFGPRLPLQVFGGDGLAEGDIVLRDEDIHRRYLLDGRRGRGSRSLSEPLAR